MAVAVVGAPSRGYGATDDCFCGPGTYDMTTGVHLGLGFETGCPTGLDVAFIIFKD